MISNHSSLPEGAYFAPEGTYPSRQRVFSFNTFRVIAGIQEANKISIDHFRFIHE